MPDDATPSQGPQDWRPRPDPTVLTTEALHREVGALRELMEARIGALNLLVESRVQSEIGRHEEKFAKVSQQLALVEQQRVEQKADTKAAVDAALTAQKEAVA